MRKILGLLSKNTRISRYVMMMQLEMADRICGKPKTKDYKRLVEHIKNKENISYEFITNSKIFRD